MNEVATNMAWAVVFALLGGLVGMMLVMLASLFLPKLIERMTPNIDEDASPEQLQWYYAQPRAV